jgi:hypothetical protein
MERGAASLPLLIRQIHWHRSAEESRRLEPLEDEDEPVISYSALKINNTQWRCRRCLIVQAILTVLTATERSETDETSSRGGPRTVARSAEGQNVLNRPVAARCSHSARFRTIQI